jgi:phosphonate transport system substrate-binding protein
LSQIEPDLAARTRVIARSEWLGFPPVCARRDEFASEPVHTLRAALIGMGDTDEGRAALAALQLDGFVEAADALFDGISERIGDLGP